MNRWGSIEGVDISLLAFLISSFVHSFYRIRHCSGNMQRKNNIKDNKHMTDLLSSQPFRVSTPRPMYGRHSSINVLLFGCLTEVEKPFLQVIITRKRINNIRTMLIMNWKWTLMLIGLEALSVTHSPRPSLIARVELRLLNPKS